MGCRDLCVDSLCYQAVLSAESKFFLEEFCLIRRGFWHLRATFNHQNAYEALLGFVLDWYHTVLWLPLIAWSTVQHPVLAMSSTIKSYISDLSLLCRISQVVTPGVILRMAEWLLEMTNAVLTLIYCQMLLAVSYRGWALLTNFWTSKKRIKGTNGSEPPHIWRLECCLESGHGVFIQQQWKNH